MSKSTPPSDRSLKGRTSGAGGGAGGGPSSIRGRRSGGQVSSSGDGSGGEPDPGLVFCGCLQVALKEELPLVWATMSAGGAGGGGGGGGASHLGHLARRWFASSFFGFLEGESDGLGCSCPPYFITAVIFVEG